MSVTPWLKRLPIGQVNDSVRSAIVREAGLAAEAWRTAATHLSGAVLDVLAAERRLNRQLSALNILADAKLYRRLHAALSSERTSFGAAFVAAAMLLQHDRNASEASVFDAWWRAASGSRRSGLFQALQLYGVRGAAQMTRLDAALVSASGDCVTRAAALVGCLPPGRPWRTPNVRHAEGLRAALEMMAQGVIAPAVAVLDRAREHADARVRDTFEDVYARLYPAQALAHGRAAAHRGQKLSLRMLRLLGLLHERGSSAAEKDLELLIALSCDAAHTAAALEALGLAGRREGAEACLAAADIDVRYVDAASRSLQAIFALDDETWAPLAVQTDGVVTADLLRAGLDGLVADAAAPLSDFQPRTHAGLVARLRSCDVQHLRCRALERQMRSKGRLRLYPDAYLTPQLDHMVAHP